MNLDWSKLGFSYLPTSYHVEYHWKDGKWDSGELKDKPFITLSIAAECLHYGQAAFEGLKAYRGEDGKIRVFRVEKNAERLISSAPHLHGSCSRGDVLRGCRACRQGE